MKRYVRILFYLIDLIFMGLLFYADQYTKNLAVGRLKDARAYEMFPGVFELRYLENRGAAFGMLQNQRLFFIIVGVVFMLVILIALIRLPATRKYRPLRFALCLVAAGALGNLYDRIMLNYVIDFLYFVYINFPIFNVADCYVTVGTALLVILILFIYKEDDLNMKKANTVKIHSSMLPATEDPNIVTDSEVLRQIALREAEPESDIPEEEAKPESDIPEEEAKPESDIPEEEAKPESDIPEEEAKPETEEDEAVRTKEKESASASGSEETKGSEEKKDSGEVQ